MRQGNIRNADQSAITYLEVVSTVQYGWSTLKFKALCLQWEKPLSSWCDVKLEHWNKFNLVQFQLTFNVICTSYKGTYFNYVRTIGGRGVGKMRTNAYRGEGGCHPYAYVRNFSYMDPTKIRFDSTIKNVADWRYPENF